MTGDVVELLLGLGEGMLVSPSVSSLEVSRLRWRLRGGDDFWLLLGCPGFDFCVLEGYGEPLFALLERFLWRFLDFAMVVAGS